jgi:hypothetical protein
VVPRVPRIRGDCRSLQLRAGSQTVIPTPLSDTTEHLHHLLTNTAQHREPQSGSATAMLRGEDVKRPGRHQPPVRSL